MNRFKLPVFFSFISIIIVFFISCPDKYITSEDIYQLEDTVKPEINVSKPTENGSYGATVHVEGFITDLADTIGTPGKITAIEYKVLEIDMEGKITSINKNGFFSFSFSAGDYDGKISLLLTGIDWNNNKTQLSISFYIGSIKEFYCLPQDSAVLLIWEDLESIPGYKVYYTKDGSEPDPELSTPITRCIDISDQYKRFPEPDDNYCSFLLENFTNGLLYSVLLQGITGQEADNWSEPVKVIPLSGFTLSPKAEGEFGQIHLTWNGIPGADQYIVLRSNSKNGEYVPVSGQLSNTFYTDRTVVQDRHYFYKIKPAMENSIESEATYCESSPFPPLGSKVNNYPTDGAAYHVATDGTFAYVADHSNGLVIFNINNPGSGPPIGHYPLTIGKACDVSIKDNHAFIAADDGGLEIVNINNPQSPEHTGTFRIDNENISAVYIQDNYAYAAVREKGIRIIDISNPTEPEQAGEYFPEPAIDAVGITGEGDYVYIAAGYNGGLVILDVSDPSLPGMTDSCILPRTSYDVAVSGSYAFVADDLSGIQILDIEDPFDIPPPIAFFDETGGGARSICVSGIYAYIGYYDRGVSILNISDPEHPVKAGSYDSIENAFGVTVNGQYGFIAGGTEGLHIINIAVPGNLTLSGSYENNIANARNVAVDGNYAYIADWEQGKGMDVVDMSSPDSPLYYNYSFSDDARKAVNITLCGNFAFITGFKTGLEIVDISDPVNCVWVNTLNIEPDGTTTDAELRGDYIFVSYWKASGKPGVHVYNIANPWFVNPDVDPVASCQTQDYAADILIIDNYLYIADGEAGMQVIEIIDPVNPEDILSLKHITTYPTDDYMGSLSAKNNYLFITNGDDSGIKIFDISHPASQSPLGTYNTPATEPGFSYNIDCNDRYLFIANGLDGLHIIDYEQTDQPVFAGSFPLPDTESKAIVVRGKFAYIAAGHDGLKIVDLWPYDNL